MSTGKGCGAPSLPPQLQHTPHFLDFLPHPEGESACDAVHPPYHGISTSTSKSTSKPHTSSVSVVLACSAAPSSRAPASRMLFLQRLPMSKCENWPRAWGSLPATHKPHFAPHPHHNRIPSHSSVVSVVLTCSAAPRSRAPASPMQLSPRLPMYKCEHWPRLWGYISANTPPHMTGSHHKAR